MNRFHNAAALAVLLATALTAAAAAVTESKPFFTFNLVPKAFSANPELEMTVFTELTDYGRTLPAASPEQPVHYVAYDKGGRSMGWGVAGGSEPIPGDLMPILQRALADRGYLPAAETDTSPELVVILHWGSHYRVDQEMVDLFPELHQQQLLERATLVGGRGFRNDLQRQFEFGSFPSDHTPKKDRLYQQAVADLYYVVVSAYEKASVLNNTPRVASSILSTPASTWRFVAALADASMPRRRAM